MDDMQLLHECKDNHNHNFSERQSWHQRFQVAPEVTGGTSTNNNVNDLLEYVDKGEILQHLESIDTCYSERRTMTNMNTLDCVTHAQNVGLFNVKPSDRQYKHLDQSPVNTKLLDSSLDLETTWKSEYNHQRD